jgi:hypothetical protein
VQSKALFVFFSCRVIDTSAQRCQGNVKDLDGPLSELPRTRELTDILIHGWAVQDLWKDFGIVSDVVVCQNCSFLYVS